MKILVVEDKEENRKAAAEAIQEEVDFATTFEEAVSKLEAEDYAAVIIDRHFPRTAGKEPEQLGEELEKVVTKYRFPHIILTEFKHGQDFSQIYLEGENLNPTNESYGPAKTNPQAWVRAWKMLKSLAPNMEEILESRKRYRKYNGKPYIMGD